MPRKLAKKVFFKATKWKKTGKFTSKRTKVPYSSERVTGQLYGTGKDIFQAGVGIGAAGAGVGFGVGAARGELKSPFKKPRRRGRR